MKHFLALYSCLGVTLVLGACGGPQTVSQRGAAEPEYVTVQHILVAFKGSTEKNVTRSKDEAEQLALEILHRAKTGEDFDELVTQYTDDSDPGIYGLANTGAKADKDRFIYAREDMAASFGDVSFGLAADEIGMAVYDSKKCKFGWHIIKRLR